MNRGENSQSSAKLALAIRKLRSEVDAGLLASEPIAVVGVGCRFPGQIASADDYWRFLISGGDAIREVPPDRWPANNFYDPDVSAPGKMNGRWGGFLDGADLFDPVFFGISPREAAVMDPQQRLTLEVAWEAIHDSGRAPGQMAGTSTGVFIAVYNTDYNRLLLAEPQTIGPNTCAGGSHSMASGRISFLLDLHGPSISIDSACSSSLVSIHLAVQSLRTRDCDTAIAGGVSLKLTPEHYLCLSKLSMLSPDGRCHTFDSAANGFVPGEGCGIVVLKRLSDALAAGDRIRAVVRGSAAGQDGRTASLTAPNGPAQQQVIRAALANARVQPGDVGYVETHGTGTALGDPIEVEALASVIGSGPKPCALGAVKSNFGHLEAASGVAGFIKAALVLENGEIPPNLHYHSLNPHISLEGLRFYVPTKRTPWVRDGGPRLAGVSSFGFTGTNAHVILEEPPRIPVRGDQAEPSGPYLLAVSARTGAARDAYAARYAEFLQGKGRGYKISEICRNAALRRDHFEERLAVAGETHEELQARLEDALSQRPSPAVSRGRASLDPGPMAFVFSGQGSQWPGMGVRLLRTEPRFAAAIDRCDALIREEAGWSLTATLEASEAESLLPRTEFAQPAIFALQVALFGLWGSWGIRPAIVLGHSVGEIAAAHAAGVLDLREAVRVAVHRGRMMDAATGHGRMLSVALPAAAVEAEIPDSVSIAAFNAPSSTVVSGDPAAIEQIAMAWQARGVSTKMLPFDYAFHSAQMEPYRTALPTALGELSTNEPATTLISTVSGASAAPGDYDANYWGRNVRNAVRFQQAIECALRRGATCFLEVGPHAVLASSISECATPKIAVIPSLRRNRDERASLAASLGRLYTLGYEVDWKNVCGESKTVIPLPAYPYQRRRCWVPETPKPLPAERPEPISSHALPGEPVRSPALQGKAWQTTVTPLHPLICDHKIAGSVVFPLAGFLQAAASAWKQCTGEAAVSITSFEIGEALQVAEPTAVQTVLAGGGFEIHSLAQDQWRRHAAGRIQAAQERLEPVVVSAPGALNVEDYYRAMLDTGLEYGPGYRSIGELRAGDGQAEAAVSVNADVAQLAAPIAPALLDGCLQTVLAASGNTGSLYIPAGIERFDLYRDAGTAVHCRMKTRAGAETDVFVADFDLAGEKGEVVAAGRGLRMKRVRAAQAAYEIKWEKSERLPSAEPPTGRWLVVAEQSPLCEAVLHALSIRGAQYAWRAGDDSGDIEASGCRGVLYLPGVNTREDAYANVLKLLQQIAALNATARCELWLATRNAQRVASGDASEGHAQAVVWGLARTAALEYPDLRCVRADLDGTLDAATALVEEMLAPGGEDELAFRGRERYSASLVRVPAISQAATARRLVVEQRGTLDALNYRPAIRRIPTEDEVEIEVHTTALNFRDVLNALGAYPGDPGPLGLEFCGRVRSVGRSVTNCKPGDLVMGIGWGSFTDVFVAKAALLTVVPAGLGAEDAVTLPNAFATAYHCLATVGGIANGDRVLIHAAAGGVGMMAVQIAIEAGAEVFATAGSDEKRQVLRSLGVRHVFDSRKLDFAGQVLDATGGAGVDLALNSLAGDFIPATLSAVANGGRFVEIGKTGVWDAERVNALGRDIHYTVVDLGHYLDHEPQIVAAYLRELGSLVERGAIRALPKYVFDFDQAADAFRFMAQARHTGKIVLRHGAAGRRLSGVWLLTGGLGALGIEMARWLASRGASTLVLAGRRPPTAATGEVIEGLKSSGVQIEVCACDVSNREQVAALLENIRANHEPLQGIVHLAGTLDDGVLGQQNPERFERVFGPKTRGAWNLHELAGRELQHFILFSSAAGVLGSPAQGNYAAANAALDALANHRAAGSLPAVSIEWGAWADAGMAARVESSGARRTMSLLRPVSAADYLAALESALESGRSNLAILSADWRQWNRMPGRSRTQVAAGAALDRQQQTQAAAERSISEQLAELPSSRRRKVALDYLRAQTVRILGLEDSYPIDENEPLMRLGLDSLMALELRNTLARLFDRSLSATLLFDHPTLGALATFLVGPAEATPSGAAANGDALFDGIAAMTDEEAEQLLAKELSDSGS